MSTSSATAEHEDALSSGVVFLSSEFMATAPHQARHDSSEIQVEDEGEPYSIDLTNDEAEPTAEDEDATISEGSVLSIESMPTIASQAQHIGSEIQVEDEGNGETNTLAKDDAESTPKFSFLAFPAEIRNLIYEMALVCGERHLIRCHSERYCTASLEAQQQRAVIMTNSIYTPWGRKSRGFGTSTPVAITLPKWRSSVQIESPAVSLFMVSRQIRQETMPIFWGRNEFQAKCSCILAPFIHDQPPLVHSCLRRLSLAINLGSPTSAGFAKVYHETFLWAEGLDLAARFLRVVELDVIVHDYRDRYSVEESWWEEQPAAMLLWSDAVSKIRGVKKFSFVFAIWRRRFLSRDGDLLYGSRIHRQLGRELARKVLLKRGEDEGRGAPEHMRAGRMVTEYVRIE